MWDCFSQYAEQRNVNKKPTDSGKQIQLNIQIKKQPRHANLPYRKTLIVYTLNPFILLAEENQLENLKKNKKKIDE